MVKGIKQKILKEICEGYDLTLNELKAECIVNIEEVIDLTINHSLKEIDEYFKKLQDIEKVFIKISNEGLSTPEEKKYYKSQLTLLNGMREELKQKIK